MSLREGNAPSQRAWRLGGGMVLALVSLYLTRDVWDLLLRTARADEESAHILLAPVVFVLLVWVRRKRLRDFSPTGQWAGPLLMAVAFASYFYGMRHNVHTLTDAGAILLAIGAMASFSGYHLPLRFAAALGVLVFLIPIWPERRMQLSGPLQEATARITQAICEMLGMVVERQRSNLLVNGVGIAIVEACNGMRMVLTLLLVCYAYAFLLPLKIGTRIAILVLSPVAAVACNVIRLVPTVWVYAHASPGVANRFHDWSGWVMLAAAFGLLAGMTRLVRWVVGGGTAGAGAVAGNAQDSGPGTARLFHEIEDPTHLQEEPGGPPPVHGRWPGILATFLPALIALALLGGVAGENRRLLPPADAAPYHARVRLAAGNVPMHFEDWTGTDVPMRYEVVDALHPNLLISRCYRNSTTAQEAAVMLIQCDNALTLENHFPTTCYGPTLGYALIGQQTRDWSMGDLHIGGMVYEFSRRSFDASQSLAVANFMVMPGGHFARDIGPVRRAADDIQKRYYGAAQMQILFDPATPPQDRDGIVEAMLRIFEPALRVIAGPTRLEVGP